MNDDHKASAGTAGGIGALLLALFGGVARHADDIGRGIFRHADDLGRVGFHHADDFGRSGPRAYHVDELGNTTWYTNGGILRVADDGTPYLAAIDGAENIGTIGGAESVVNELERHVAMELPRLYVKLLEHAAEDERE